MMILVSFKKFLVKILRGKIRNNPSKKNSYQTTYFPIMNSSLPPFTSHSVWDILQISGVPGGWVQSMGELMTCRISFVVGILHRNTRRHLVERFFWAKFDVFKAELSSEFNGFDAVMTGPAGFCPTAILFGSGIRFGGMGGPVFILDTFCSTSTFRSLRIPDDEDSWQMSFFWGEKGKLSKKKTKIKTDRCSRLWLAYRTRAPGPW